MDDSVLTCDEIIEEKANTVTTNFNEKHLICCTKKFCFNFFSINYYCIIDSC